MRAPRAWQITMDIRYTGDQSVQTLSKRARANSSPPPAKYDKRRKHARVRMGKRDGL